MRGLRGRLASAGQQRDYAISSRDQLQAAVDRAAAEKARAEEAHQAKLGRLAEERSKAVEELADARRRIARLEQDLEASVLRENGMLGEAQHLDETFARKYRSPLWAGMRSRRTSSVT